MLINEFTSLPVLVLAARNDGVIETGDKLISWVKNSRSPWSQRLYFENETRLVLHGNDGTEDVLEGWWLVKHPDNHFEVLDDETFHERYRKKA